MTTDIPESHDLDANYFAKMHADLVRTLRSPTLPRKTRRELARAAAIGWFECAVYNTEGKGTNRTRRRAAMQGGSRKLSDFGFRNDAVRWDAQRRAHAHLEKMSKMSDAEKLSLRFPR